MTTKTMSFVILINAALMVLTGCLKRTEKITVAPDGRATMQLTYEGDPDEFENGDAMPGDAAGWSLQRKSEFDDEGKEEVTLTATQQFASTEDLPRSYASPNDDETDLYLDFPTSVQIDRRRDGTYYYFTRTYTPRKWAYMQHWQDTLIDDNVQKLSDKPVEQLS